jgi:hypothetical protein
MSKIVQTSDIRGAVRDDQVDRLGSFDGCGTGDEVCIKGVEEERYGRRVRDISFETGDTLQWRHRLQID